LKILLAEDHRLLARSLKKGLEEEGFAVDIASAGDEADFKARSNTYDVVILDLMLPHVDGLTLLKNWRSENLSFHILVLTAMGTVEDKVKGLDLGADDYLVKPFELNELLARVRALVRRGHQAKDPVIKIHDLEIDTGAKMVRRAGKEIYLTPREFALLRFLAYHRGKVVSRSMIWEHLYDENDDNTSNVVDVYIRYLRNKIDKNHSPQLILTRWGEGYMIKGD
jgi:DNA-binding response OmpR family regulator